jgi:hypothetical protein
VDVGAALVADGQPAVRSEPRQCPLHDPPSSSQPATGVLAPPRDADLDPAAVESPSVEREVVTLIRMPLLRSLPGPTPTTLDRRDRAQQHLEELAIVDVSAGDQHREGVFGVEDAGLGGVRRGGPGRPPPANGRWSSGCVASRPAGYDPAKSAFQNFCLGCLFVRFEHPIGRYSPDTARFPLALPVPYRGFETRSKVRGRWPSPPRKRRYEARRRTANPSTPTPARSNPANGTSRGGPPVGGSGGPPVPEACAAAPPPPPPACAAVPPPPPACAVVPPACAAAVPPPARAAVPPARAAAVPPPVTVTVPVMEGCIAQ